MAEPGGFGAGFSQGWRLLVVGEPRGAVGWGLVWAKLPFWGVWGGCFVMRKGTQPVCRVWWPWCCPLAAEVGGGDGVRSARCGVSVWLGAY